MSELKKCPFCGGEAELHDGVVIIPVIDENGAYIDADVEDTPAWVECAACGATTDGVDSADEAITAWNRRTQPENEPLTLSELRGMGGEPVWIQESAPYTFAGYKILCSPVVDEYEDVCFEGGDCYYSHDYGKTKRKLELLKYITKQRRQE